MEKQNMNFINLLMKYLIVFCDYQIFKDITFLKFNYYKYLFINDSIGY